MPFGEHVDAALEQAARNALTSGEKLLWIGTPRRGLMFRPWDAFLVPFSLVWTGSAFSFAYLGLRSGPDIVASVGLFLCLVGIYITVGRFLVDMRTRSRTVYAITDQRALVIGSFLRQRVQSIPLKTLDTVALRVAHGGQGTIVLGSESRLSRFFSGCDSGLPGAGQQQAPRFERIVNAQQVHAHLLEAMRAAQR
jgi:hypothetical protein